MMSDCRWSPKAPEYLVLDVELGGGFTVLVMRVHEPHLKASRAPRILESSLPAAARMRTISAFGAWPRLQWRRAIGGPPSK